MMKNIVLILFSLIISFKATHAQSLSETEKLAATAKVWGFLKYYYPKVAKGKFDWDNQLLVTMPSIEKASSKEEISSIYLNWIESLGEIKVCKKCQLSPESDHFDKSFDLTWFENSRIFTEELTAKLKYIEQNRFRGKPYYVTTKGRNSDLVIANEKPYDNFEWTNKSLRLLSLFRYWNTIEYFYPHKYQLDTDWDTVLFKMLPKFSSTDSESAYHLAMLELVVKLDDSHGYFTSKPIQEHFGVKQIPAAFKIIDGQVVITGIYDDSLARLNDIRIGDVISRVEGVEVTEVLKQNLKYINGSNYDTKLRYAFGKILNGSSDSVKVEITRGVETRVRKLARYTFDQFHYKATRKAWEVREGNIGYVNLGTIDGKELASVLNSLMSTSAIILDLRGYPKAFYGYHFKNFLGARNEVVGKQIKPDLQYPGKYILSDQSLGPKTESRFKGKVVLLVDESTQSRAEYTAMWIQNGYNVTTIGSQTAGAGGVMISQEFVGGFKSYFTSSGVFYPDMTPLQRKGVKIDIEVKPTVKGITEGKDEILEKAIEFVNSNA